MSGQNRRNRRKRPARNTTDDSLADLMPSYAPKQRETFLKGFRILAKVAVRAHLHRQSAAAPRPDDGPEEEDTLKPSPSSTWAGAPVLGNGEPGIFDRVPDCAIFANTRWESLSTHVDGEQVLKNAPDATGAHRRGVSRHHQRVGQVQCVQQGVQRTGRQERPVLLLRLPVDHEARQGRLRDPQA